MRNFYMKSFLIKSIFRLKWIRKTARDVWYYYSTIKGAFKKFTHPYFYTTPSKLVILTTPNCNLKCSFCSVKEDLNKTIGNPLSLEEWEKIITNIPRSTVIELTGGEAFLTPNINKIITMMGKRKLAISIISNGSVLTDQHADLLINSQVTYFMISLDGLSTYHNRIRGKKNTFEKATIFLKRLAQRKREKKSNLPLICIKTVISEDNTDEIIPLLEYIEGELQVDNIQFELLVQNKYQSSFSLFKDFNDPNFLKGNQYSYPKEIQTNICQLITQIFDYKKSSQMGVQIAPDLGKLENYLTYIKNQSLFSKRACFNPWSEVSLLYNGNFTTCISYAMGNIRSYDYNIKKLSNSKKYLEFLNYFSKNHKQHPTCEGCNNPKYRALPVYASKQSNLSKTHFTGKGRSI
jgi:MoaA/NifB/PqqE/SkfB family radical SAM enzyme